LQKVPPRTLFKNSHYIGGSRWSPRAAHAGNHCRGGVYPRPYDQSCYGNRPTRLWVARTLYVRVAQRQEVRFLLPQWLHSMDATTRPKPVWPESVTGLTGRRSWWDRHLACHPWKRKMPVSPKPARQHCARPVTSQGPKKYANACPPQSHRPKLFQLLAVRYP